MTSLTLELQSYFARMRTFTRTDWAVYTAWVGLMVSLVIASGGFILFGRNAGAVFPEDAYLVPVGAFIFSCAIAVDTIGHRTVYKEDLKGGEAMVHHIIIFAGIGSCVLLCLAYPARPLVAGIAMVLTILSFVYSLFDEALHWRRYLSGRSDVVEMWSHVFILIGHGTMMWGWWRWYYGGYVGVAETLQAIDRLLGVVAPA